VRRLGGRVQDEADRRSVLAEDALDRRAIADVDVVVRVLRVVGDEPIPLPAGRCVGAEELAAHVVVDARNEVPALTVELHGLRPDEAG
jgi:hypothetical protein